MGILDWIKKVGKKVKKGWDSFKSKALPVVSKIAEKVAPFVSMIPGVGGIASKVVGGIGKVAGAISQGGAREGWKTARQVWKTKGQPQIYSDQNVEYPQLSKEAPIDAGVEQQDQAAGEPVTIGEGSPYYSG
jgi:hypothetical protein